MISVRSTSSNTGESGSVVIDKPVGLTVGDLMVAFIGNAGSTPTGWAVVVTEGTNYDLTVFSKTADASDVSASTFTFSGNDGVTGTILAVTGHFEVTDSQIVYQGTPDASSAQSFSVSIDVGVANSLAIMCAMVADTSSMSISGYTITGQTNPTWTEVCDYYRGGTDDYGFAVAYATLSTSDAITAIGYEQSETTFDTWNKGCIIIIQPTISATANVARLDIANAIYIPSCGNSQVATCETLTDSVSFPSPTCATQEVRSTNTSKNAGANIVNTSKS